MTLAEYLAVNGIKASTFADTISVPPSTVLRLLKGERSPRLELLKKIMEATNGAVTPNDFLSADEDATA